MRIRKIIVLIQKNKREYFCNCDFILNAVVSGLPCCLTVDSGAAVSTRVDVVICIGTNSGSVGSTANICSYRSSVLVLLCLSPGSQVQQQRARIEVSSLTSNRQLVLINVTILGDNCRSDQ